MNGWNPHPFERTLNPEVKIRCIDTDEEMRRIGEKMVTDMLANTE